MRPERCLQAALDPCDLAGRVSRGGADSVSSRTAAALLLPPTVQLPPRGGPAADFCASSLDPHQFSPQVRRWSVLQKARRSANPLYRRNARATSLAPRLASVRPIRRNSRGFPRVEARALHTISLKAFALSA